MPHSTNQIHFNRNTSKAPLDCFLGNTCFFMCPFIDSNHSSADCSSPLFPRSPVPLDQCEECQTCRLSLRPMTFRGSSHNVTSEVAPPQEIAMSKIIVLPTYKRKPIQAACGITQCTQIRREFTKITHVL